MKNRRKIKDIIYYEYIIYDRGGGAFGVCESDAIHGKNKKILLRFKASCWEEAVGIFYNWMIEEFGSFEKVTECVE